MKFTAISETTGQVLYGGEADDPLKLAGAGVAIVLDQSFADGWIEAGDHHSTPVRPAPYCVFDWATKTWVDPRSFADKKAAVWELKKKQRAAAINAPLETPFGTFDCDSSARTNITDSVLLMQTLSAAGSAATIDFTLADNTTVILTAQQMVQVGLLLGQKVQTAYAVARAQRVAIEAATTDAELEAI